MGCATGDLIRAAIERLLYDDQTLWELLTVRRPRCRLALNGAPVGFASFTESSFARDRSGHFHHIARVILRVGNRVLEATVEIFNHDGATPRRRRPAGRMYSLDLPTWATQPAARPVRESHRVRRSRIVGRARSALSAPAPDGER